MTSSPAGPAPREVSRVGVWKRARAPLAVFLLSLALYHANLRPVASSDSVGTALLPFAIVLDGTVRLDRFGGWLDTVLPASHAFLLRRDGHYYLKYPLGQALLLTPLYAPLIAALDPGQWPPERIMILARVLEKLFAALLAAFSVVLFFILVRRLKDSRTAWWAAAVLGLATPVWSINSQALWQHSGGVLLIVAALLLLVRWAETGRQAPLVWASVCCGFAASVRPTNALLCAAVVAVLAARRKWRECIRFLPVPALCVALTVFWNMSVFSDPRGGYALGVNWRVPEAVAGMLFSPSRGLLVYCPFVVFAAAALPALFRKPDPERMLIETGLLFSGGHLLAAAMSPMWWGGHCWGPRLLVETVPFLVLGVVASADLLVRHAPLRAGFAVLIAWSVFLQATGAFCYPRGYWDDIPGRAGAGRWRYWSLRDSPIERTLAAGPVLEPYAVVLAGVVHGPAAAEERLRQLGMKGY